MTSPASQTIEQTDDDVVAALETAFQLPSFVPVRSVDAPVAAPAPRGPEPTTLAELLALALFALLALGSAALVAVSLFD